MDQFAKNVSGKATIFLGTVLLLWRLGYLDHLKRSRKPKATAFLLCLLFGWLGIHRYYLGRYKSGILYTLTFGFFFIGVLVDLYLIATNEMTDSKGRYVTRITRSI